MSKSVHKQLMECRGALGREQERNHSLERWKQEASALLVTSAPIMKPLCGVAGIKLGESMALTAVKGSLIVRAELVAFKEALAKLGIDTPTAAEELSAIQGQLEALLYKWDSPDILDGFAERHTEFVAQKGDHDCACAAMAMFLGIPYDSVWNVAPQHHDGLQTTGVDGLFAQDVADHFKVKAQWETKLIPGHPAILSVPSLNNEGGYHSVFYDGTVIHDPLANHPRKKWYSGYCIPQFKSVFQRVY